MSVIIELEVDADAFDLGKVTHAATNVHLELERVVPIGGEVLPFFWASGGDFAAFEEALQEEKLVEELTAIARTDERVLYHVRWGDTVTSLTTILERSNATILEAHGNDPWTFRLRFLQHAHLRDFQNYCREYDIDFHVTRIFSLEDGDDAPLEFDITPEQHEALVTAVERGYFEVPRRVKLGEVADELGISVQATSERVRRGENNVLRRLFL